MLLSSHVSQTVQQKGSDQLLFVRSWLQMLLSSQDMRGDVELLSMTAKEAARQVVPRAMFALFALCPHTICTVCVLRCVHTHFALFALCPHTFCTVCVVSTHVLHYLRCVHTHFALFALCPHTFCTVCVVSTHICTVSVVSTRIKESAGCPPSHPLCSFLRQAASSCIGTRRLSYDHILSTCSPQNSQTITPFKARVSVC